MATISSQGIGSGLDVDKIVKQLIAAERQPVQQRLDQRETRLQAELTAFGSFKSALSSFRSEALSLDSINAFQGRKAESADESVATAQASTQAVEGSYDVDVTNVAKAHSLASTTFSSKTDAIASGDESTGELTFRFGTTTVDPYNFEQNPNRATGKVTIDSTNNSLEGIRDAVNEADIGVNASIVNDDGDYKLTFVSDRTGADHSIQVTVDEQTGDAADNTDTTGLSRLAFNGSAQNMNQAQAAQDADLSINGVSLSSASNTLDEAIEGATLALQGSGSTTIDVSHDKSSVKENINQFVEAYNNLRGQVNQMTQYNEDGENGVLLGDSTVRNTMSQLRSIIGSQVEGLSGNVNSLAAIGITTNAQTGKLEVDASLLDDASADNFDKVGRVFAAHGNATDALVDFQGASRDTQVGTYDVSISQEATRGKFTGGDLADSLVIDSSNDELSLAVDGVDSSTFTISQGTYDTATKKEDLATELQSKINGDSSLDDADVSVSVNYDGTNDRFVITSDSYGSDSTIGSIGDSAASALALDSSAPGATDGQDVEGSIDGVAADGDGRFLTGNGDAEGLRLEVRGGGTGFRGEVSFSRGVADQLNNHISGLLGEDDIVDARTDGIESRIDDITRQRRELSERMTDLEERYRDQFTQLDVLMSELQGTQARLDQQLASLPGARS